MSNNTYTAKETSFWKFIQENEIEIPIIQRDYAQGRLGKESLRKNFLGDLKKALDNEKPYKDKAMKMDFVYGSVEHAKMNPLDGQQRLTTLWLLHWYIALRAGKMSSDKIAGTLNRFSYETRISSREFCGNLCDLEHFKNFDGKDIVGFITRQTWFYSAWKQDPTIQSMLRMLGGTKVTDKKGEDIVDGIEELFEGTDNFEKYWDKLTSDNAPIVFYHLPLKDFGLSDDLYIKMNARGKQLTSFENFKADLVDYITERSESELEDAKKRKWKSLLDECEGIPIRMDTAWTDIFWNNKPQKHKIDEIYFAFLNRFFGDKLFMCKSGDKYVLDIGKGDETSTQENNNPSYKYLNNSDAGPNVYDTTISYKELDVYKFQNGKIPYSVFGDLQTVLSRYAEIPACSWDDSFRFIPAYENDKGGESIEITDTSGEKILKVTYLNQVQRVVFHAVCKYFKDGEYDKISLKQWMRIVWNLVSGEDAQRPQIRSTSAMRSAMEFIDKLDSHDVYNCLARFSGKLSDSEFDKRCKEEIEKAKQILDEDGNLRKYKGSCKKEDGSDYQTWEEIIIDAESYAFFKGAIRFLFQNENGGVDIDTESGTWNTKNFDTKLENARTYFDDNGVKDKKNSLLLRTLISYFTEWKDLEEIYYNNEPSEWRNWILLNKNLCKYTNCLLIDQQNVVAERFANFDSKIKDDRKKRIHEKLVKSNILDYVINRSPNGFILSYDSFLKIESGYKSRSDDFVFRIDFLDLSPLCNENTIKTNKKIQYYDLFNGWNVDFEYKNNIFRWFWNPNDTKLDIYLMKFVEDKKEYRKRIGHINDNVTDEDTYFCFKITKEMASGDILAQLDCLIQQACAEEAGKDCFKDCPNEKGNHLS